MLLETTTVLQEVSPERLNSPTKSLSPAKPAEKETPREEDSSGKLEETTSALRAMLEAKKAARQSSDAANEVRPTRRKRTALGRALSNATDPVRLSRQNSPQRPETTKDEMVKPIMASQKLVYEERQIREREKKLFADIGGTEVEIASSKVKVDQAVMVPKSARKAKAKGKKR
jgi:hypothetical protein